eukprot:Colp12_sorted_trinity150504_noHs@12897
MRVVQGILLFLSVCSIACHAVAPGQIYDLRTWTLQIPVDKGTGSIKQIKQPELATYSSEYFYTDSDKGAIFRAPSDGLVTGNGAGPRTELTENHEFTFSGIHTLNITQQVLQLPPSKTICIAQVKGDSFSKSRRAASCLIVVEFCYNGDAQEVSAHMRDKDCNSKVFKAGKYKVGEKIDISFRVQDYDVYVATNKVVLPKYSYSFWKGHNYQMHFKVGDYVQGTAKSHTQGGKTKLSHLSVHHSN